MREFQEAFESAFEVKMIHYEVGYLNMPTFMVGNYSPVDITQGNSYTINITCVMAKIPVDKALMDYFDMREFGHCLVEVSTVTTADTDSMHSVQLTYKTFDHDNFMSTVKDIVYKRFSDEFHKQLEDKLD